MNKHYKKLDLIRVISCFSILLYHIGLLKGGYLAVCTFFVLTGYLSVISFFSKKNISLKEYYKKRVLKIYLPLIVVVFLSLGIISCIKGITISNIKPEITSIILGYNNYWQLNANLDYFVRHISSPYMHLWFIAIILQIELILPLILIPLNKIGKKISKQIPCLLLLILAILSYILFYNKVSSGNLMNAYYDTLSRSFSIIFGLLIGFVDLYYKPILLKNNKLRNIIFEIYIIELLILFIFIDFKSNLFSLSMLLVTLISVRLIEYGKVNSKDNKYDKVFNFLSKISYEIYLVQYPVIFIFQNINITTIIKVPLIIIITIITSLLIHKGLNIKERKKIKVFNILLCLLVLSISIFGFHKYIVTKDNTKEMKKLETDLNNNRKMILERQKEYQKNNKKETDEWQSILNDLNSSEDELKEKIRNLHIVGIGDSIMELAIKDLYKEFPNGYFDAVENRTVYKVNDILNDLIEKNILGDVVLFSIGTNGEFYNKQTDEIMKTLGDRKVFWINATNADYPDFNDRLASLAEKYKNIHIIDWVSVAKPHPEYIISDGVHPTIKGCKVYAETMYNAIYEEYLNEYRTTKDIKIKEHEEQEKNKITFIGNDLLLGLYDYLEDDYKDSSFIIEKDLNYKNLKKKLKENDLNHKLVFVFDKNTNITKNEYIELSKLYKDHEIYIIDLYDELTFNKQSIKVIDFNIIKNSKKYTSSDGIHLNKKANKKLKELIDINLNNKE